MRKLNLGVGEVSTSDSVPQRIFWPLLAPSFQNGWIRPCSSPKVASPSMTATGCRGRLCLQEEELLNIHPPPHTHTRTNTLLFLESLTVEDGGGGRDERQSRFLYFIRDSTM